MLDSPAVTLIPIALTVAGFMLFWFAAWRSHQMTYDEFDVSQLVFRIIGAIVLGLGLIGTIFAMTGPLVILVVPVGITVLAAAIFRYRKTEGRSLVWALTVAAERGIPLETAARAFGAERQDLMGKRARTLADYLEAAVPLSIALRRSHFAVSQEVLLAADLGERTGALGLALRKVVGQTGDFEDSIQTGLEKLFYLAFLIFWMLGILSFMMIKTVPAFVKIFEDFGMELPWLTVLLVDICQRFVTFAVLLIPIWALFILLQFVGVIAYIGVPFRSLPLARRFSWQLDSAVILRLLSIAVQHGRPIAESLRFLAGYFPQPAPRLKLERAAERIGDGCNWHDALRRVGLLGRSESAVLESAERAGNLAWALDEMADGKTRRSAYRVRACISLLFPFCILTVGALVMFVAVALMLPLFRLISALT